MPIFLLTTEHLFNFMLEIALPTLNNVLIYYEYFISILNINIIESKSNLIGKESIQIFTLNNQPNTSSLILRYFPCMKITNESYPFSQ